MTRIRKNLWTQSTVREVSEHWKINTRKKLEFWHFLHIEKDDEIAKETGFKNVFS